MNASKTLLLVFSLTALGNAWATTTILDKAGMPLCVVDAPNKNYAKFLWNADRYSRPVLVATRSFPQLGRSKFDAQVEEECSVRTVLQTATSEIGATPISSRNITYKTLPASATSVEFSTSDRIDLSADVQERLNQVRGGATVYRPADIRTPELYFSKHAPINFTRSFNRRLTARYGSGFAGDVYGLVINSRPENAALRKEVLRNMETYLANPSFTKLLGARFQGVSFVLVKGFAHDRNDDERISPLGRVLRSFGFDVIEFNSDPYGRLRPNSRVIADQLREQMEAGKRLVVVSASAATTQALGAIGMLSREHGNPFNAQFPGKVLAYVNLSGVVSGAFAPEAVSSNPLVWFFSRDQIADVMFGTAEGLKALRARAEATPSPGKEMVLREVARYERRLERRGEPGVMESFRDLSVGRTEAFMRKTIPHLTNDIIYYNFIGINEGDGIVKDPKTSAVQSRYVRGRFASLFEDLGSNDGYVEYPGTELTTKMIPGAQVYSVTFNASHVILDGHFDHHVMLDTPNNQRGIIGSILLTLAGKLGL